MNTDAEKELLSRVAATRPEIPPSHDFTDVAMGRRFASEHDGRVLHVGLWHRWYAYDGTRWAHDVNGSVNQLAKETVAGLYREAAGAAIEGDTRRTDALTNAAKSFLQMKRLEAMLSAAKTEPNIAAGVEQFDTHGHLLNVLNGTVDLRTGELLPHDSKHFITMLAPVEYDPKAQAPVYEKFLRDVYVTDELIAFMKRLFGYICIAGNPERILPVQHGGGANGKTTQNEIVAYVLGDYARVTPVSTLLAKRSEIPNDVAALRGVRLAYASESPEGRAFNESLIKAITGNDRISARFMRSEWFQFTPDCTVCLATNNRPEVKETSNAIWDRLLLIPYLTRFGEGGKPKDTGLMDKLKAEAPGILRWLVEGAVEYQKNGLGVPAVVRAATDAYRAEQDVIGAFIEDRCVLDPQAWTSTKTLFAELMAYNQHHGLTQKAFSMRLETRGLTRKVGREDGSQARGFDGIRIAYPDEDASQVTGRVTPNQSQNRASVTRDSQNAINSTRARALGVNGNLPSHASRVTTDDPEFQAVHEELLRQARAEKGGEA